MFRAIPCSSSGGQIVLLQRLVSSLSANVCTVRRLRADCLYSITISTLHYNTRHVSSRTMLIFRRSNCIITASGTVTLCKRLYSPYSLLSSGILYCTVQRVTIPDAVIIQFDLPKISMLMLETCRRL